MASIKGIASVLQLQVKNYSEIAKSRVENTKKIKMKWNHNLHKQSAQDKPQFDYSLSPQEIILKHFTILDMKSDIKSDVIIL
jgi:hypothetical protein